MSSSSDVISIRTASLGDATYIAVYEDRAIVVDPQRDIGRFLDVIDDRGLTVTHVLETHMHNDYISGGRDLARRTGADLVMPAACGASFPFVPAFHGEPIGSDTPIFPIHTPGHTPAHTSYHWLDAVFTGGSLLVGAAGRSDLLGEDLARQLSVLQFGSLQRLAQLPDDTGVYPTHGEGSFCSATNAGRDTSTIGIEKAENPLYRFSDAQSFADDQLGGLLPYPTYYAHMGPINRTNPTAVEPSVAVTLSPDAIAAHLADGGAVIDGRERHTFAAGHVPGSIGIELGSSFAPWAGWLIEVGTPIALVLDEEQDAIDAITELSRIGHENIAGVMRGTTEWTEAEMPLASYRTVSAAELAADDTPKQVLDVRDPAEWAAGHLDGSHHRYVPDLDAGLPAGIEPSQPVWVICRTGNRASIAAGVLEQQGIEPIVVSKGGVPDLL